MSIKPTSAMLITSTIVIVAVYLSKAKRFRLLDQLWHPTLPLPKNLKGWYFDDLEENSPEYYEQSLRAWMSLEPFFLSRGYTMYRRQPPPTSSRYLPPLPYRTDLEMELDYPFARRTYSSDTESYYWPLSDRVWPARDSKGRDVLIKVIADKKSRSELEIMQFLNTERARSDPRNHTIPVIEFLDYQGFAFVVMPRWGPATQPDFESVPEIIHMAKTFLEAFDFLHEHRITHGDFLEQNIVMDVVFPEAIYQMKGLRDPSSTKYALIDFGLSLKYPLDLALEEIKETRAYRGMQEPCLPYSPFALDIYIMGTTLEVWVRHLEGFIPELGPFFDALKADDPNERPTARQALERLTNITENLSDEQLSHKVRYRRWRDGVLIPRKVKHLP